MTKIRVYFIKEHNIIQLIVTLYLKSPSPSALLVIKSDAHLSIFCISQFILHSEEDNGAVLNPKPNGDMV